MTRRAAYRITNQIVALRAVVTIDVPPVYDAPDCSPTRIVAFRAIETIDGPPVHDAPHRFIESPSWRSGRSKLSTVQPS